jgi:hypothetical protein
MALVWPWALPDKIRVQGLSANVSLFFFVWIYCLFFWLVQDVIKVYTVKLLRKYKIGVGSSSTELPESTLKMIKEMDEAEANGTADHNHHKH